MADTQRQRYTNKVPASHLSESTGKDVSLQGIKRQAEVYKWECREGLRVFKVIQNKKCIKSGHVFFTVSVKTQMTLIFNISPAVRAHICILSPEFTAIQNDVVTNT